MFDYQPVDFPVFKGEGLPPGSKLDHPRHIWNYV